MSRSGGSHITVLGVPSMLAVELRNLIGAAQVEVGALLAVILLAIGLGYKYRVWIRTVPKALLQDGKVHLGSKRVSMVFSELVHRVLLQRNVITDSKARWVTHFTIFWGFIGLIFATAWVFLFYTDAPRPLTDLGKVVGNVGGAMVLAGTTIVLFRYVLIPKYRSGRIGDITFFIMLYLATISGFTTELARLSGDSFSAYSNYISHLILVFLLVVTAPFTHFIHAVLTPFMRYIDRMHLALLAKKIITEPDYRKRTMADQVAAIVEGKASPQEALWLRKKEKA